MNALQKTGEQRVSASASKQVAKPRRSKDSARDGDVDPARREDPSRTRLSGRGGSV